MSFPPFIPLHVSLLSSLCIPFLHLSIFHPIRSSLDTSINTILPLLILSPLCSSTFVLPLVLPWPPTLIPPTFHLLLHSSSSCTSQATHSLLLNPKHPNKCAQTYPLGGVVQVETFAAWWCVHVPILGVLVVGLGRWSRPSNGNAIQQGAEFAQPIFTLGGNKGGLHIWFWFTYPPPNTKWHFIFWLQLCANPDCLEKPVCGLTCSLLQRA